MVSNHNKLSAFIEKARKVHGDKYDYSKVRYVNNKTKVIIICPEHGEFEQEPKAHISGHGCKICGIIGAKFKKSLCNLESRRQKFIEKVRKVHGGKYDYSKVEYVNKKIKISIICPIHGEFEQTPTAHLRGGECRKCTSSSCSRKDFVENTRLVHGDKYDYSKVEYVNNVEKVVIICPEHGEFEQRPHNHLAGKGCLKCGQSISRNHSRHILSDFINRSNKIHNNKYDYSKVEYINNKIKVIIICPEHGEFKQTPMAHRQHGCQQCSIDSKKNSLTDFLRKANNIHENKYDYSKVEYVNNLEKVTIICPEHGEFEQSPVSHVVYCYGCPNCRQNRSQQEIKLVEEFKDFNIITNDRSRIGKEIDIYFSDYSLGVEVNGLYWHRDSLKGVKYHQEKFFLAKYNQIKLLQFWEHELTEKWDLSVSMIRYKLGLSRKIYARKCDIIKLDNESIEDFLNYNHMQGYRPSSVNYGLLFHDNLVSILTLSRHPKHQWEIIRFCSSQNVCVIGGFSKLLKQFKRDYNPTTILTFADLRYSVGDVYKNNGFSVIKTTSPNYFYFKGGSRNNNIFSRQRCQKHKLRKLLGDRYNPNKTELENMTNSGYHKVSDAGNIQLIWSKQ